MPTSFAQAAVSTRIRRLRLTHTWTTVMSSSDTRDTFFVEYRNGGITGVGEGAPILRYHETAETARAAVEKILPFLRMADPASFTPVMDEVFRLIPGEFAAKAAVGLATSRSAALPPLRAESRFHAGHHVFHWNRPRRGRPP